jgi:hypothetical protein
MKIDFLETTSRRKLSDYERIINLPRVLAICLLVTALVCIVMLIGRLIVGVEGNWEVPISLFAAGLFSAGLYLINRKGYNDLAARGLFLLVITVISYNLI